MQKYPKWLIVLQLLVTGGLLAWIFSREDFLSQVSEVLRHEQPSWLWLGLLLAGLSNFFGVIRWQIFLRLVEIRIPFWRAVQLYWIGLFFSTFLIGVAGGDAAKALILIGQGYRRSSAFLSVVLDRVCGLVVLVLSSMVLMALQFEWLSGSPTVRHFMFGVMGYLVFLLVLLIFSFATVRWGWPDRLPQRFPFRDRIQEFCRGYYVFVTKWPAALIASGISLIATLLYYAVFFASARASGVGISLGEVWAFMPIIEAIIGLPISFGGIGVREHLFSVILGELLAVSFSVAVWTSLTGFILLSLWGLAGALVFPFFRMPLQKGRAETSDESH